MVNKSTVNAVHTQENESAILGKDLTIITNANFSDNKDLTSGGSENNFIKT
jgi:hypothetical protein